MEYISESARSVAESGFGGPAYADHLERAAFDHARFYTSRGDYTRAELMLTQSLGDALAGNDGE